jgi:hypothetical protein
MSRFLAGRALLATGAALDIASMLVPWGDPNNHYHKFSFDWEFFVDCAGAGAVLDGLRLLAEGVGCISPSILGGILLLGALLPRGKAAAAVSSVLHVALLLTLAGVAGTLFAYDLGDEGADRRLLIATGSGAALFVALAFAEYRVAVKSLRRAGSSGDAVHVLPLVLFLLAGAALAILLRGSEVWHSADYAMIAAGSALALAGLWLRRGETQDMKDSETGQPDEEGRQDS